VLRQFGTNSRGAASIIRPLLVHADLDVRQHATNALLMIHPDPVE
jgi:hypothetical protein